MTKVEGMFGWDGELPPPAVRTLLDMQGVLASQPAEADDAPLYFMYRDLAKSDADWRWLHAQKLRYDITVIPARDIGGEWTKTKGHYHPTNPAGIGYPEIYEVFAGQAHYLLQSRVLDDVVLVSAKEGDLVIMPPGYGHVTINPSRDQALVMANIVSTAFESEYADYEHRKGAAYYEMTSGELVHNPHYPAMPPVRHIRAKSGRGEQRMLRGPLYSLIGNEEALAFLNHPEDFAEVFRVLLKD